MEKLIGERLKLLTIKEQVMVIVYKISATVQNAQNPQIYIGTWDGTFVYSWTQNPVWIVYDLLTNIHMV